LGGERETEGERGDENAVWTNAIGRFASKSKMGGKWGGKSEFVQVRADRCKKKAGESAGGV